MWNMFVCFIALFSMSAMADSACWPEQKLLGTPAKKIIHSANAVLEEHPAASDEPRFDVDWSSGACYAKYYNPTSGKLLGEVDCGELLCVNGDCGTDQEHATLAVVENNNDFVQSLRKTGEPVWLKWIGSKINRHFEPVLLWNDNDYGVISAELDDTQLYLHKEIGVSLVKIDEPTRSDVYNDVYEPITHVYKVIGTEVFNGTTFLKLQIFSAMEEGEGSRLNIGDAGDVVYLEHRDPDGNLIATLSHHWCD